MITQAQAGYGPAPRAPDGTAPDKSCSVCEHLRYNRCTEVTGEISCYGICRARYKARPNPFKGAPQPTNAAAY